MGKWRDKLFIFVNYEQEYIPQSQTRTQTLLTTEANAGDLPLSDGGRRAAYRQRSADRGARTASRTATRSDAADAPREAAAARGSWARCSEHQQPAHASRSSGTQPQKQINYYPTARLDYQITPTLSWMGSWNLYRQDARGPAELAVPDISDAARHVHSSWWITSTGAELDDQLDERTTSSATAFSTAATRRPAASSMIYGLNGIVNGLPARFVAAARPLAHVGRTPRRSPAGTTSRRSTTR